MKRLLIDFLYVTGRIVHDMGKAGSNVIAERMRLRHEAGKRSHAWWWIERLTFNPMVEAGLFMATAAFAIEDGSLAPLRKQLGLLKRRIRARRERLTHGC